MTAGARTISSHRRLRRYGDRHIVERTALMPQYAILIYEKEIAVEDIPSEVMEANMAAPDRISQMGARIIEDRPLAPASQAMTIRQGGVVTDGPFLESKEAFAGIFVVEARDLEQAIAIGKLLPIMDGGIEVRPVLEV